MLFEEFSLQVAHLHRSEDHTPNISSLNTNLSLELTRIILYIISKWMAKDASL